MEEHPLRKNSYMGTWVQFSTRIFSDAIYLHDVWHRVFEKCDRSRNLQTNAVVKSSTIWVKGYIALKIGPMTLVPSYNLLPNTTSTTTPATCDTISNRTQPTVETMRLMNSNVTGQAKDGNMRPPQRCKREREEKVKYRAAMPWFIPLYSYGKIGTKLEPWTSKPLISC